MRAFPCGPRAKQDGSEEGKDPRCYGVTHDRVCHAILRQLSKIKLSSVESRGSVQAGCIMSATRTKNIGGNWLSLPISEAEHFTKIFARWALDQHVALQYPSDKSLGFVLTAFTSNSFQPFTSIPFNLVGVFPPNAMCGFTKLYCQQ